MTVILQPKLRFKKNDGSDFPDWKKGILGDYGKLIKGLTYSPKNIVENGLLVLRSSNVQKNILVLDDNVFVNLKLNEDLLSRTDDIIICVRNGSKRLIGKNAIVKNQYLPTSTHGAFMTNFRGESNKFVFQWFQTQIYKKYVWRNLGATINSINNSDLKKFKTVFPLEIEQQKIASFLSSVDKKIELLTKKHELLEKYKKGLMQKIFSQQIRFKQDDGSDFPEWEFTKIKNKYAIPKAKKVSDGLGPYLEIGDIDGRCNTYELKDKLTVSGAVEVDSGILLISTVRPNLNKITITNQKMFCSSAFIQIKVENNFLFYCVIRYEFRKKILGLIEGGTYPTIKSNYLLNLEIEIPVSKAEENKISSFLSSVDKKIELIQQQINRTKTFKKGLLQQMFV